ncbi:MAG: urea transporter, partial [Siphonobacter aquaeclarae]|nr:urea transporter [Siphonobacter aquaeclarae]
MNNQTPPFLTAVLNGIGQIMLQENAWTGLLFLIGIFYGDVQMGLAALAGTVTGTLTARLLGYDDKEIRMGLYGFSPALVGVALTFLFAANGIVWVLVIAGAAMAAVLQHFFIVRKIPVFTFPFIVVTWALVFLLHKFTGYPPSSSLLAPADLSDPSDFTTSTNG